MDGITHLCYAPDPRLTSTLCTCATGGWEKSGPVTALGPFFALRFYGGQRPVLRHGGTRTETWNCGAVSLDIDSFGML